MGEHLPGDSVLASSPCLPYALSFPGLRQGNFNYANIDNFIFFLEMCLFSGWAEGLHPDLHNCSSRRRRFIISSLSLVFKQRLFYFIFIVNQGVVNDPKRLLFWAFAFPALLVIVASNIVIYMKIRGVSTKERVPTNQMKMNNFFLMLFLAFLAWLFTILPFVIVDTVIDPCFQVVLVVVLLLVAGPSNSSCCRLVPCQQKLPCISVLLCTIRFYTVGSERFQQMHLHVWNSNEWLMNTCFRNRVCTLSPTYLTGPRLKLQLIVHQLQYHCCYISTVHYQYHHHQTSYMLQF